LDGLLRAYLEAPNASFPAEVPLEQKTIGFIGLGVMGKPMAKNLVKAGYRLTVYDHHEGNIAELVRSGAQAAGSAKEVAEGSDVVLTMLPDSPNVEEAMLGENGILEGARSGCLVIDMSSIAPEVAVRLESKARIKDVRMLDAPVSGGEPAAVAGMLAIMVGGAQRDFEEAKEILQVLGKSVVRMGATGAGQYTKLVNQILVAVHLQAMAEALVFAKKAGLDVRRVYEAIRHGLAGSNVLDAKVPLVLRGDFTPGFRIRLQMKDLRNALAAARQIGAPLPATTLVHGFFEACEAAGRGDLDHGALITAMEELAKTQVRST